ncbi:WXG100 family type VII secretion target [Streptomyces catenulae]|uniref:ESAT-6-like protein n=1 Tax=Streptomyces catenulae TaxID=66875 RepID=A0ABV2YV12_9ACTN|nr:WXG100 family type VII secretion target [Streptomyces catenulae]
MSGHILVNAETIQQASQDVKRTAGQIRQQLDDLEAGVKRIASTWEGAAKEGYQARQREWDKRAHSLQQTLEAISKALHEASVNYRDTEHRNANMWNH